MNYSRHLTLGLLGLILASCSAPSPASDSAAASALDAATIGRDAGVHGDSRVIRDAAMDGAALIAVGQADAAVHGDASVEAGSCPGIGHCVQLCEDGACSCQCDCRSDAQCGGQPADGEICVPSSEPAPSCCGTRPVCSTDTECARTQQGPAWICNANGCGSCQPPCANDASCGDGSACRTDGHCTLKSCKSDGYVCPAHSHCGGSGTMVDQHGCVHDACATDKDCQSGACVNGRCFDSPGRCVPTSCG